MNFILFDGAFRNNLLPFTYTRPVADIRFGILTIREKWEIVLETTTTTVTEDYLSDKYPMVEMPNNIMINASFCPHDSLVNLIKKLEPNQAIFSGENILAFYVMESQEVVNFDDFDIIDFTLETLYIEHTWDIFSKNGVAIEQDFELLTKGKQSGKISKTVNIINPKSVFIEKGAQIEYATLNASSGPIYIGKDAIIMEGSLVRGPLALCEKAVLKMGAKIYGPTTIGPHSKVGGELTNSVLFGYSNKGHDGFLGNSVIGEWCNLGADSNNSNLKNNYAEVKLWDYNLEGFSKTGLQFCGLMMGDHSKCGINTMFNTGTVVGVSANIFGSGFPRNFIPSFSWGGHTGFKTYLTKKAFEVSKIVMARRHVIFTEVDASILEHVFNITNKFRRQ
ncbi:GlmU family protein [Flavobacteriaceae bacterium]|jgi:UDP-N-acetylglucosamine diphosphorylase/glucosamine-1-phosphate N-acetyltransferase|nr:GlmU family protein [Flavobacteriaceae bacterium]